MAYTTLTAKTADDPLYCQDFNELAANDTYLKTRADVVDTATANNTAATLMLRGASGEFASGNATITGSVAASTEITGPMAKITPEGGIAVKLVAGEALAAGNIVSIKQASGADGRVWKCPTTGNEQDMPMGVAHAAADVGAVVWVVVAGLVSILPDTAVTAVRGYVIEASTTTAGHGAQSATAGGTASHWRECGHWVATGGGAGAATLAVLHWN